MSGKEYTTGGEPCRTIGIDCRFAGTKSGIGRYTRELVRCLLQRNDPWRYVLFAWPHGELLVMPSEKTRMHYEIVPMPHRYYSIAEQLRFPSLLKQHHIDLLHVPHFNAPLLCPIPFVVTIHDLILHQYPNQASLLRRAAYRMLMSHAVKKSAHIFAVSAYTADEIKKAYGEGLERKIGVTHEGVSNAFHAAPEEEKNIVRKKYGLPTPFVLYAGACKEHKNVQMLINAISSNQTLVLITGGKEIPQISLKPNVRILSDIPDSDFPILMSAASVYVQPSLYEGFGLPVPEAMACGTPVVASNRTSIPEIAGGHAILVEPTVEGFAKGIIMATTLSSDLHAAEQHARSFSWEAMAQKTAETYASLLIQ